MNQQSTLYSFFVDESGEAGIENVRSETSKGASPYMVLGAALMPRNFGVEAEKKLQDVSKLLNKEFLHCNRLNHAQKVLYARKIAELDITLFGVISFKETLGSYKGDIKSDSKKYYNKCAQYLFERLGQYMQDNELEPEQVDICMEEGSFDCQMLRNFISACQRNPIGSREKFLSRIRTGSITTEPKQNEPLLQIADLAAHSLYQCIHKSDANYYIPEPRYFRELERLFPASPMSGLVMGYGVKPVHNLKKLGLDNDILEMFEKCAR